MSSKVNFVNIPKELKSNASYCLWKLEKRQGRPTKVPFNPRTGEPAKTNDPLRISEMAKNFHDILLVFANSHRRIRGTGSSRG